MLADAVLGLSRGDEGKGKIVHALLEKNPYTHVMRFSGGHNAGHTIYHKGQKVVTHIIPGGVLYGIKSIIGPGCVVNPEMFFKELEELSEIEPKAGELIKISHKAHIISDQHLEEDRKDVVIGTTKRGNGPAYRDKYARVGVRAEGCDALKEFLVDVYEEIYSEDSQVLLEGAQGFYLDPDFGDYPYVTSAHCGIASALQNGVSYKDLRDVYGVVKAYETYVGAKKFSNNESIFVKMQEIGQEFGATTGRPRQCGFLNFDELSRAVKINGVSKLIVNKMDVLRSLNCWHAKLGNDAVDFGTELRFKDALQEIVGENVEVIFSYSPEKI